ncbi:MAG: PAS domain-containing protein, partial [Bacteroidetes bacterium]
YKIHGLDSESYKPTTRSLMSMVVEEDRARLQNHIRKEGAEMVGLSIMYRIRRPDGNIRILHTKAVVEDGEDGKSPRRYGTTQDVTDGKSIEAASISLEETKTDSSNSKSPLYILFCDTDGTVTYVNLAFSSLTPRVNVGDSIYSFSPYFNEEKLRPVLRRVEDRLLFEKFEFTYPSDGKDASLLVAIVEPIISSENLNGYSFYVFRKADRPDTETVAAESYKSLSEALRIARIGHWERDLSEERSEYSDQCLNILGVDPDTFVPSTENFFRLVHPDDVPEMSAKLKALYEDGKSFEHEFRILRTDGSIRYVIGQGERFGDEATGLKVLGTVLDITDHRLMLNDLRQSEIRFSTLFEETKHAHEQLLRLSRRLSTIQEEERRRIALDLHDEAGGLLTAIQLALQMIIKKADKPDDDLARAERFVDELIDRIHHFTHELRPASLDQLGLRSTLLAHFREFEDRHGIALKINLNLDDDEDFRQDLKIAVFRITQEALNNVARHAFVTAASITVKRRNGELEIVVVDKGVGTVGSISNPPDRIGLDGMRERALLLGGTLEIKSIAGEGTTLRALLPV